MDSLSIYVLFAGLPKNTGAASRLVPQVASGFSSSFARRGDRSLDSDGYFGEGVYFPHAEIACGRNHGVGFRTSV